jgi:activator of HSP90 ATPase
MGSNNFELTATFPASPEVIFDAWLSGEGHSALTGSPAQVEGRSGGTFSAWDGYIWGVTLEMERPRRILQSWRTSEFPEDEPDSLVEILLERSKGGTKLTLRHSNMPEGQEESYKQGWEDFYFKPMKEYFK